MKGNFYCLFQHLPCQVRVTRHHQNIHTQTSCRAKCILFEITPRFALLMYGKTGRLNHLSCTLTTMPLWPFGRTLQAVSPEQCMSHKMPPVNASCLLFYYSSTIVVAGCCLLLYLLVSISCLFSNFVAFAMM